MSRDDLSGLAVLALIFMIGLTVGSCINDTRTLVIKFDNIKKQEVHNGR